MEQKNLLLAIILSAIIMVGFQWYTASQRPAKVEATISQDSKNNLPVFRHRQASKILRTNKLHLAYPYQFQVLIPLR